MEQTEMEIEHVPYIFGSFTRRRHSQEMSMSKRRSTDPTSSHTHSQSQPYISLKGVKEDAKSKTNDSSNDTCSLCNKLFEEPRVLPCLHTFCTKCLLDIENKVSWSDGSQGTSSRCDSGGSGYDSEQNASNSEGSRSPQSCRQRSGSAAFRCPICDTWTPLPHGGVLALPPNYILQHRIVLASLNNESTKLLCDMCPSDVMATGRCSECLVNLCGSCTDFHAHQRLTSHHEVLGLREARLRGITKVHRHIMCSQHMDQELVAFCSTCSQVVCRECAQGAHLRHACEPAQRAASRRAAAVQHALDSTRSLARRATATQERMRATRSDLVARCRRVEQDVEQFVERYVQALQKHKKTLLEQLSEIKEEKLLVVQNQEDDLEKRLLDAQNTIDFAEDLIKEGSDIELLTFIDAIIKKLESCNKIDIENMFGQKISESIHFLPNEIIENPDDSFPLFGVITTQTISPNHCAVRKGGLENLRVHRKAQLILETKDSSGNALTYGGENVTAELWYREAGMSCRSVPVHVQDLRDGTYLVTFVPDTAGRLSLALTINGQRVKDSPFLMGVRNVRPHHGIFHCCTFCSSGGSKEGRCACGGTMPGGYRGCGHGHDGHPGRRHWSCCGNVLENSECTTNSTLYHFTL